MQRARILWRYHSGQSVAEIARAVKMTRKSVAKWIAKALAMGVGAAALRDTYHRPKTITVRISPRKPVPQNVSSGYLLVKPHDRK